MAYEILEFLQHLLDALVQRRVLDLVREVHLCAELEGMRGKHAASRV